MSSQLFRRNMSSSSSGAFKANFNRYAANMKARAVQGDVTINLRVDDAEPSKRAAYQQNYNDQQRMGSYTDRSQVNVARYDLVYTMNTDSKTVRSYLPAEQRDAAIVSFNALPLMGAKTRDDFQRFVRFMGVAKITYLHQDLNQPDNGISVQHKGATTIRNDGVDTFNAGDKIAGRVPHVDPLRRARQLAEMGHFKDLPQDRLTAVPERVSYDEVNNLSARAVAFLFRSSRGPLDAQTSLRNLRAPRVMHLNQLDAFAISMKHVVLQIAFNTIAVASRYGLISLNMPEATSEAAYTSLDRSVLNNSLLKVLNNDLPVVRVSGSRAETAGSISRTDARAVKIQEQLRWLALKLELVHDSENIQTSRFKPSSNLQEALLGVTFAHLFSKDDAARSMDVRRFLDMAVDPNSLGAVRVRAVNEHFGVDTYGAQLAKSQHDSMRSFYQSAAEAKNYVDSTIIGTSLGYSRPKDALHINL